MKFILNESNKFILDERFILTEADEDLKVEESVFKAIKEKWGPVKQKLAQYATYIDKLALLRKERVDLETIIKEIARLNKDGLDIKLFKETLRGFYEALQQVIAAASTSLEVAPDRIKGNFAGAGTEDYNAIFKDLLGALQAKSGDTNNLTVTDLNTFYQDLVKSLPVAYPVVNESPIPRDVKTFETRAQVIGEALEQICSGTPELFNQAVAHNSDDTTEFQKFKELLLKLPTALEEFASAGSLKDILDETLQLNNLLTDTAVTIALKLLVREITAKETAKKAAEKEAARVAGIAARNAQKKSQKADWETLYAQCKTTQDFKNFWDGDVTATNPALKAGYWKSEWETNFDFISTIKGPLSQEIKAFGWNAADNPFINYLKNEKVTNLTKSTYNAVHNAFIAKIIDKNDLVSGGELGDLNLLFNSNFQKIGEAAEEYLDGQDWVVTNATRWGENLQVAFKNIMAEQGNLNNLLDEQTAASINQGFILRPIAEVKAILQSAGKSTTKIDKDKAAPIPATDEEVATLIKKFADPAIAKKVLSYLTTAHRKTLDKLGLTPALLAKLKANKGTTITTYQEDETYDREFKNKLTTKQLINLLTTLAEQANL